MAAGVKYHTIEVVFEFVCGLLRLVLILGGGEFSEFRGMASAGKLPTRLPHYGKAEADKKQFEEFCVVKKEYFRQQTFSAVL